MSSAAPTATDTRGAVQNVNRVSVDIMGERYWIRGDADTGYIAEVAREVDNRMRLLRSSYPDMSKSRIAILTAINMADELLNERRKERNDGSEEVLRRTQQLIELLDEGLSAELPE
ncbi:MAG: cell division protein ZapA [Spirochaetia bacterium]|nr:cell division protein ZapA [Spirochaetia bacterium]